MNLCVTIVATLTLLACAEWSERGPTRMEVVQDGHVQQQKTIARSQAPVANKIVRGPWERGVHSDALCKQLRRMLRLKASTTRNLPVFLLQQATEKVHPVPIGEWPLRACKLPKPVAVPLRRSDIGKAVTTVALAASATPVERLWRALPAGGVLVVPLKTNSSTVAPDRLVWQSMYQLNSRAYYSEFHNMKAPALDLPDLQFATYFNGYGLLQKADWKHDLHLSQGRFHSLASTTESDKISHEHNYSLLYHRNLDTAGRDEKGGLVVDIGTGCKMKTGLGESVKFWPQFFQRLRVHLLRGETDRKCLALWMDRIAHQGVAKVHIGRTSNSGRENPLHTLGKDIDLAGPRSLAVVVDSDQGDSAETEASFRGLFPKIAPGGLYFLEDITRATWGSSTSTMPLQSKWGLTGETPLALAASMGTVAAGLGSSNGQSAADALQALRDKENPSLGLLSKSANWARDLLQTAGLVSKNEQAVLHKAWAWHKDLSLSHASMTDLVECSPGICAIQRSQQSE